MFKKDSHAEVLFYWVKLYAWIMCLAQKTILVISCKHTLHKMSENIIMCKGRCML